MRPNLHLKSCLIKPQYILNIDHIMNYQYHLNGLLACHIIYNKLVFNLINHNQDLQVPFESLY